MYLFYFLSQRYEVCSLPANHFSQPVIFFSKRLKRHHANLLFAPKTLIEIFGKSLLVEISNRQKSIVVHDHSLLVHLHYLLEIDNVGTMHTHEFARQSLFHPLHAQKNNDGLGYGVEINLDIFAHALHIADVLNGDPDDARVALHEDGVGITSQLRGFLDGFRLCSPTTISRLLGVIDLFDLVGRTLELVQSKGLEQVIDRIDLVALNGILTVGCSEHDDGRSGYT